MAHSKTLPCGAQQVVQGTWETSWLKSRCAMVPTRQDYSTISMITNITMEWLHHRFPHRLITAGAANQSDPQSTQSEPHRFFFIFYLWWFLNEQVYENRPQSIAKLKVAITHQIRATRKEECVRVMDNFACQVQECLLCNGSHLEHVL